MKTEQEINEKVAILDFGAQYGKVFWIPCFIAHLALGHRQTCQREQRLF